MFKSHILLHTYADDKLSCLRKEMRSNANCFALSPSRCQIRSQ